ncbi:MAG: ABC transporter ATP-binding protein, partial [Nannocystaceae bacterium]|nr:ABC transporter ATP-binding protein [Nannocystaceae bacterium]
LQRAGLAQALMGDPDLVVLDEPMSGLDPLGRKEVHDLIIELKARGKTVFFSTHILADATALCDRVGIIVAGELRDVGPLGELLSPKVHSVDVVVKAAAGTALPEMSGVQRTTSEGIVVTVDGQSAANEIVASMVNTGGQVIAVRPHRQTLEELFVVEAAKEPDGRVREVGR